MVVKMILFWVFCCAVAICQVRVANSTHTVDGSNKILAFEETMRSGPSRGGQGDSYIWPGEYASVQVGPKGHLFVCIPTDDQIVELDQDGAFVRRIGKRGQGPGEFQSLRSLNRVGNRFFAFEAQGAVSRVNVFNSEFKFIERKEYQDLAMVMETMLFSPDGKRGFSQTLRVTQDSGKVRYYNRYLLLNESCQEEVDLLTAQPTGGFDPQRANDRAFWVEFLSERFRPIATGEVCYGVFDRQGNFYLGISHTYEITRRDEHNKVDLVISKPLERTFFSEEEKVQYAENMTDALREEVPAAMLDMIKPALVREAMVRAGFPEYKYPVRGLNVTDDQHLLVLTGGDEIKDTIRVEVFSPTGQYVGHFQFSYYAMQRMVFSGSKAYTLEKNEDGDNELVGYQVTWKKESAP